jgi:hypothetical protein
MPVTITDNESVKPSASEQGAIDDLLQLFACEALGALKLIGVDGTSLSVPPSAVNVLRQAAAALSQGRIVLVDDLPTNLTIDDAADLLGVRPGDIGQLVE